MKELLLYHVKGPTRAANNFLIIDQDTSYFLNHCVNINVRISQSNISTYLA